jgi:hypothetical protein
VPLSISVTSLAMEHRLPELFSVIDYRYTVTLTTGT